MDLINTIYSNGFSFDIRDDYTAIEKIVYKDGNYYPIPEKTKFTLRLGNPHDVRVDAHVWIDGVNIGYWRINPRKRILVDRPSNDENRFVINRWGTMTDKGNDATGLIKVVFIPEKFSYNKSLLFDSIPTLDDQEKYWADRNSKCKYQFDTDPYNDTPMTYIDGVTPYDKQKRTCMMEPNEYVAYTDYIAGKPWLWEHDYQKFVKVERLRDDEIDKHNITTIYARLIADNNASTFTKNYTAEKSAPSNTIPIRLIPRNQPDVEVCKQNYPLLHKNK